MKKYKWLLFILVTIVTQGIWGAFSEMPEKEGFPATFTFIVWAFSMIPCAIVAFGLAGWKFETDKKSLLFGCIIGFLGAGGQLILFQTLRFAPAYIVFPFISMLPIVVITLSVVFLKERATKKQVVGIITALVAIFLLSRQSGEQDASGYFWIILSSLIMLMWGIQGTVIKLANNSMRAESIFIYMTITGLLLTPVAYYMTDLNAAGVNLDFGLATKSFFIQILNAVGVLTLVFAFRYGKAIIVSPMEGLVPVVTVVLSLALYSVIPSTLMMIGLLLAVTAIIILALE